MINAEEFAIPQLFADGEQAIYFGSSKENSVAALRKMADQVESGKILIHRVTSGQTVTNDHYVMSGLYIMYAEKREVKKADVSEHSTTV